MTRALELYRSLPRYVATRAIAGRFPSLAAAATGTAAPLRLSDRADPALPGDGWVTVRPRLSGICGSDLATVTGRTSFYFSPLVSMPFVPGHEVVGELQSAVTLADGTDLAAGRRVVIDPVLGCAARALPLCPGCSAGHTGRCDRVTLGHISPGLQTGYCKDTGGGWSRALVAHASQLHAVADDLPDTRAVLIEPLACAVHTALRARIADGERVLIVGAGSVGLFTLLALRALTPAGDITMVAKHRRQVELARLFGASTVLAPSDAMAGVRRSTRAMKLVPELGEPYLLGGVDVAVDCAGSAASLSTAMRSTRAGGRVVLCGLPSGSPDLTPLWFRELELIGAYATGSSDFALAAGLAATAPLDGVVSATYPLARWREALDHALSAGRLGATKIAFDLTAAPR